MITHGEDVEIHALRTQGWSISAIARGVSSEDAAGVAGVSCAVGWRWFRQAGGMPPICLAPVSGRYLSFAEREEIAIAHAQGAGVRAIARRLGRSPSTISRELRRNASTRSYAVPYRATTAQWHAQRRASRPKVSKLAGNDTLRAYVQDRLAAMIARPDGELVAGPEVKWVGRRHGRRAHRRWATSWSPEQISRRLRVDFPDDESMRISHEAICPGALSDPPTVATAPRSLRLVDDTDGAQVLGTVRGGDGLGVRAVSGSDTSGALRTIGGSRRLRSQGPSAVTAVLALVGPANPNRSLT